jgi:hypothetical protein
MRALAIALIITATAASAEERPAWLEDGAMLMNGKDMSLEMAIGVADDARRAVLKAGLPCETLGEAEYDIRSLPDIRVSCDGFVHTYTLSGEYGRWEVSRR